MMRLAWLERAVEAPEPLDHPRALLRDDAHTFDDERDHDAEDEDPEPVGAERRHERCASAAAMATASFQSMVVTLGSILRHAQRVAVGGEHVDGGARLERIAAFHARAQLAPR